MKKLYPALFLTCFSLFVYAKDGSIVSGPDTNAVKKLNASGYDARLSNPSETIKYADMALALATKISYPAGIAEAYRIKGIGEDRMNKPDSAINCYFSALQEFDKIGDKEGQANVYNNIGNLYQEADYKKAIEYFDKATVIAKATHNNGLLAKIDLNRGNIYYHKFMLNEALTSYTKAYDEFKQLNSKEFIILCLQNLGVVNYKLNQKDKAEQLLLEANHDAKEQDMNLSVASINLELVELYVAEGKLDAAEKYLREGQTCAQLIKNERDLNDYDVSWYELELKRGDYKQALVYLRKVRDNDSVLYRTNMATNLSLADQERTHKEKEEIADKDSAIASQRFWSLAGAAGLLLVIVGLLTTNVKRKAVTNAKLTELNNEVSRQKDNLDRINHHLEEIIDERTRDLQAKNRKLSEYSSYLSHQIRGPIATLKGLMNLEKEGLVGQAECINMMDKCVSEIDEKIIEMSDMLHDTSEGDSDS